MFTEDDFIQLSALQHYVFCPRQCALIHVEDVWHENVFTVLGKVFVMPANFPNRLPLGLAFRKAAIIEQYE
jgi:hypothetical protein